MRLTLFLICFLYLSFPCFGAVIFQDNFDDHSDWSPEQKTPSGGNVASSDGDDDERCTNCPDGTAIYAGYRVAHSAWTDYVGNTMTIDATNYRGASGKGLTFWYEPTNSSYCDDGTYWCSDQIVVVQLPTTYDELYIRYYIKFQPGGWVWDDTLGTSMKMAHISHYVGGGMFTFFKSGYHWPLVVPSLQESPGSGSCVAFSPRKQSCYYPNDGIDQLGYSDYTRTSIGSDVWNNEGYLADGDWHHIEWHMKGNSSEGAFDGIMQCYIDGANVYNVTNVCFADRGKDESGDNTCDDVTNAIDPPSNFAGWNMVMIGGNCYNRYYDSGVTTEQWYAIDDLVISTTYVGEGEAEAGAPSTASSSTPANSETGVSITQDLSWTNGSGTSGVSVYFDSGVTQATTLVDSGVSTLTTYDTGTMEYSTIYAWKIIDWNENGDADADDWVFTTAGPPGGESGTSRFFFDTKPVLLDGKWLFLE